MAENFWVMRLKKQLYLKNGLMNQADWLNNFPMLIVIE